MTSMPSANNELEATILNALLPPQFPVRRDIEVVGGITTGGDGTSFFDHLWLDQRTFLAYAIRLPKGGLDSALKCAALRQLMRALLMRRCDLRAALQSVAELGHQIDMDAAVLQLDTVSGASSYAARGTATVSLSSSADRALGGNLEFGDLVWLTVGDPGALPGGNIPEEGLHGLVLPALARTSTSAAGCAILVKSAARAGATTTFALPNEQAAIPPFLADMERFLSSQPIEPEDLAGLDIALDELLTNVVNYGFRDGLRHEILVSFTIAGANLQIEVRDDGVPFDPLSVPEPNLSESIEEREIGGLGMHFVRSLLDSTHYCRRNGWNELTLEKRFRHKGHSET